MILGLDPAIKSIGWARGDVGVQPRFGVFELPEIEDGDYYQLIIGARDFITDQIKNHGVIKVRYEAPYIGKSPLYIRHVTYVDAGIEYACGEYGITCLEVSIQTWRSETHGYTRAPKTIIKEDRTPWLKRRAKEYCRDRGWDVKNADEAEACCILAYQLGKENPGADFSNLPLGAIKGDS